MGSALNVPVWHCRSTGDNSIDNRKGDKPRWNCNKKIKEVYNGRKNGGLQM